MTVALICKTTRDRTVQLFISKIDLDYANVQMKLSEETSRQCVIALTGGKFTGYNIFKKRILRTRGRIYQRQFRKRSTGQ